MIRVARNSKQIGNIVRRVRRELALSQAELGKKAGVRQGTISLVETGNADIKIETLLAVLASLDLEIQVAPRSKNWSEDLEGML